MQAIQEMHGFRKYADESTSELLMIEEQRMRRSVRYEQLKPCQTQNNPFVQFV